MNRKQFNAQAEIDGWAIFSTGKGGSKEYEIQRYDDMKRFESDEAAQLHVVSNAAKNNTGIEAEALKFLFEHKQDELDLIKKTVGDKVFFMAMKNCNLKFAPVCTPDEIIFIDAMQKFKEAATQLSYAWDAINAPDLIDYPFEKAYDDVVIDINSWVESSIEFVNDGANERANPEH